jgi:hypothetical protein
LIALGAWVIVAPAGSGRRESATGTPTTVRFSFKAEATKVALLVTGTGTLTLSDAPRRGVFEQARAVLSAVMVRRGGSSATFSVSPTGATYAFLTTIGVFVQEVRLVGRITRSTVGACKVGTAGAIVVEAERNLPARRALFRLGSFADNGVIFRLCGVQDADPGAMTRIVATP